MFSNTIDSEKGETPMTDYQFEYIMKLKDKVAELTHELSVSLDMPGVANDNTSDGPDKNGMTDYQFKQYETLRDKCEVMTRETNFLRMENAMLKSEIKKLKKSQSQQT